MLNFFKESPERTKVPVPGDKGELLKAKVRWKVDDAFLHKITEKYSADELLWQAANRKIYHLTLSGTLGTPGVTYKTIPGTQCFYLRDRGTAARIFLRQLSDSEYELLAVVSGAQGKRDEEKVFKRITELF